MTYSAYTAWLLGGGEKGRTFSDYLKKLGLLEKEKPLTKKEAAALAKKAYEAAEKIKNKDKLRVKNG